MFKKFSIITIILGAGLLGASSLRAESFAVFESPLSVTDSRYQIDHLLWQLDDYRYDKENESLGFSYLFSSRFFSPYSYDIYGGNISRKIPTTIIRLEGGTGDVRLLARILEQKQMIRTPPREEVEKHPARPLDPKSHLVAQGLNLLAPWGAVLYASWDSPRLSSGQTWFRFLTYFFFDLFMVYGGGSNWFRESFQPGKYSANITAGLVFMRLIGAVQQANLIRGHNRVAELKYTFYLD